MDKKLLWRIVLILVVVGIAGVSLYPPGEKIHYGLDLSGGIHLVLEVQTDAAIRAELEDSAQRLVSTAADKGITLQAPEVDRDNLRFTVQVPEGIDTEAWDDLVETYFSEFDVSTRGAQATFSFIPEVAANIRDMAVRQAKETITNRVDQFGVAEPVIQRQGMTGDRILVQLPGVDDPARVKDLISDRAFLEYRLTVAGPAPDRDSLLAQYGGQVPANAELATGARPVLEGQARGPEYYLVSRSAIVTGRELRSARRSQDEYGQPVVRFDLAPSAADKFGEFTGSHIGDQMAVLLDGKVVVSATIRDRIRDSGRIEGNYSVEEAEDLSLKLRAGALPAPIVYLEERTVGPSLGRDSVVRGLRAGATGMALVVVFMVVYYRMSGLNANLALALNVVLLLGAMAYFGATLTLPGIAGVILTIGMAVDANVLIFERIREELKVGKTVRSAIDVGFSRAFGTILDANLTTLIAALFLFNFGTGPVKGFAVTLTIGILCSVFTAVFVSRTVYMLVLQGKDRVQTLSI